MKIRLLFVDEGSYHQEEVEIPEQGLDRYERLIDYLREDEGVQKRFFMDTERLCSAWVVE